MSAIKPMKGMLREAQRADFTGGHVYTGVFDGHPEFHGKRGHTSYVVREGDRQKDGSFYIETLNSRYLIYPKTSETTDAGSGSDQV